MATECEAWLNANPVGKLDSNVIAASHSYV